MTPVALFCTIAGLLAAAPGARAAGDRIVQKTGAVLGEKAPLAITEETFLAIKYKAGAGEQQVALSKIAEVVYGEEPEDYRKALAALEAGRYDGARELFQRAAALEEPPWVRPAALFRIGVCLARAAKYPEAIAAFKHLQSKAPTSRFLPDAMLEIGKCHFFLGQFPPAKAAFAGLRDAASSRGFEAAWGPRARYWLARVLEREGAIDEASREYESLAESEDPWLAKESRARAALAGIGKGAIAKTRECLRAIADSEDGTGLEAAARLGLGECAYAEGKLEEARYHFLWTVTLVDRLAPGTVEPDVAAKATYFAGLCFESLKDEERNAARAREMFRRVVDLHPASEWAPRAKDRLGR